ncbi:hypothetical protein AJ79_06808 [Helicocarpus griseus UAMH5409]|uniref:Uncharacterized protein n=1 Tax=Helicocarpus griseus UAMH5409 TaxID=1447875 RepID=A0A2B7X9R2_9EURO|nr:hypothetical protein AJ79_06808 [Helicocarpus griseus UAMH5409]
MAGYYADNHVEFADSHGITLIAAAAEGRIKDMEILLNNCTNPAVEHTFFGAPLHAAAWGGHTAAVSLLLDRGASPHTRVRDGYTALHLAATAGNVDVVQLPLNSGAEANAKSKFFSNPLICAAATDQEKVAKLLLARKDVDVNSEDIHPYTPISYHVLNGYTMLLKRFLESPPIRPAYGSLMHGGTPLIWACHNCNTPEEEGVLKVLLQHSKLDVNFLSGPGDNGLAALGCAASIGFGVGVKLLLAHPNIDVNQGSESYFTALEVAAAEGHEDIVQALLACPNLDVNQMSTWDDTALYIAARKGNKSVVHLLIGDLRVDALVRSYHDGETPMTAAAVGGHEAIVKVLLMSGSFYGKDGEDRICESLDAARANGHLNIVSLLELFLECFNG